MATRKNYRDSLTDKLVALEDGGYGDLEFTTTELNTYLELTVARLYPAVYKRLVLEDQTVVAYGNNDYGKVDTTAADRVYLVEDSDEMEKVGGWVSRGGTSIIKIDRLEHTSVNLYYHDAYTLPANDVDDAGIPDRFKPLIIIGALIETLESRHDTGVRGDEAWPNGYQQVSILDRYQRRWDALLQELGMSLPAVEV